MSHETYRPSSRSRIRYTTQGRDPRRDGPSSFSREEAETWSQWLHDPDGTTPHRDAGSRSRPISIGPTDAEVDELYERMVARGIVSG